MKKILCCLLLCLTAILPFSALAAPEDRPIPDKGTPPSHAAVSFAPGFSSDIQPIPTPAPTLSPETDLPAEEPYPTPSSVLPDPNPPLGSGQSGRGSVENLKEFFEEKGYPEHLSFVFKAGGELRNGTVYEYWQIGMVDATEVQKQAILELAAPTCLITFENALFSHAEKVHAYDAISALNDPNIIHLVFGTNTDTVWVGVAEEKTKEYAEYLIRDLGLGAVVSVTDEHSFAYLLGNGEVITPGGSEIGTTGLVPPSPVPMPIPAPAVGLVPEEAPPSSPSVWPFLIFGLFLLALLLTLRSRLIPLFALPGGKTLPSAAQTEQAVADSLLSPPENLYRSILKQLET